MNTAYHNVPEIGELIYEKEVVFETNVKDKSFYSYADYQVSSDEEKIQMAGVNGNDDVLAAYEKLNSFFKKICHEADFDRLYEESKRLVDVVKKCCGR